MSCTALTTNATMATRPAPSRYRPRRPTEPSSVLFKRLPLGFPLPPTTVPMDAPQTKSVEYYRAAPTAPGMSYSIDLERVNPPTRPGRSSSDVAPLATKRKPITVPLRPDQVQRPPRSPARQPGYFDETAGAGPSGPPGPPPMGPLPPIPDLVSPFGEGDPMMLRAAAAKERRDARRQSKLADSDIAALERSMRRLSRISLASAADERTSGPTSPTSVDSHLMTPSLRAEKLLRRISRQSDGHGVRLPADYGRVGISGYSVPSSAPVSPGLRGVPPPLHERSELAYLVDKPALSVPMRRNVESSSSPGAFAQNSLGLGLRFSDSISTMPSITTMSTLPSDTLSTLPSDATITPESQTRATRLNSLSSATTASTTSLLTPVSPPTSTEPLPSKSPMSPPKPLRLKGSINLRLPTRPLALSPGNTRGSSPDIPDLLSQYRDSLVLPTEASYRESTVLPRHSPVPSPRPETLAPMQPSRSPSPSGMVQPTRLRPGARPRTHSDLVQPDDVPVPRSPVPRQLSLPQASPMARSPQPRQSTLPTVGPKNEPEHTPRSSTESRVAVEDSGNVLDAPPMRQSLESQVTPRPSVRSVSRATRTDSVSSERPASPDISYILRTTPRPTRKSSVGSMGSSLISRRPSMAPSAFGMVPPSSFRQPVPMSRPGSEMSMASSRRSSGVTASSAGLDVDGLGPEVFYGEQYDSADSDSDLDLATPLPHMMLRAGLLSPRSTIITEAMEQPRPSSSGLSARGEALRAKGEKVWKAEARRKVRHRDGRNLRDGVGLTTGLGWSDSEDEDAPSPLRRRLSSVLLAKAQSRPPSQLSRQSYTNVTLSRRSTYSNLDSTSVSSSSQSLPRTPAPPPLSLPITPSSLPGATRTVGTDEFGKLDFPMPPTATSWRGMPSPGLRKAPSNGMMRSASATSPGASGIAPPSSMRTRTPSTTSASASSAAQSPRTSASVSSRGSLVRPAPRSIRVNIRPPTGTRLSAPEALRQAEAAVDARRLSGA